MTGAAGLRIVVAGTGFGASVLLPALRAVDGIDVPAILGSNKERTAAVARAAGVRDAATTFEELLDRDVDAVAIALPPRASAALARLALERGIDVFLEKPIAHDLATAAALARLGSGRVTAVDFEFAEADAFRAVRRIVNEQRYGSVHRVDVAWHTQSRAQEHRAWSWKTDAGEGGGVLPLLGSHVLHLAEMLVGPIRSVSASADSRRTATFTPVGSTAAADGVSAVLVTEGGVPVTVALSNSEVGLHRHRWLVACESATLEVRNDSLDPMRGLRLVVHPSPDAEPESIGSPTPQPGPDGRIQGVARLVERFAAAVRGGDPMTPNIHDGHRVQQLIDAVERSSSSGQLIDIAKEQTHAS